MPCALRPVPCAFHLRLIAGTALAIGICEVFVVASDRCEDCEVMNRNLSIVWLAAVFLLVLPCPAWAWSGKVVGVSDGDTITVLRDKHPEKIRLFGIDCPEKRQPFGNKAKQFTSDMVFGKTVEVNRIDTDRYGRTVAFVVVGNRLLNEELVMAGLAWVYDRYCYESICDSWKNFQLRAKLDKQGLWGESDEVPPWEYRRQKKR